MEVVQTVEEEREEKSTLEGDTRGIRIGNESKREGVFSLEKVWKKAFKSGEIIPRKIPKSFWETLYCLSACFLGLESMYSRWNHSASLHSLCYKFVVEGETTIYLTPISSVASVWIPIKTPQTLEFGSGVTTTSSLGCIYWWLGGESLSQSQFPHLLFKIQDSPLHLYLAPLDVFTYI